MSGRSGEKVDTAVKRRYLLRHRKQLCDRHHYHDVIKAAMGYLQKCRGGIVVF